MRLLEQFDSDVVSVPHYDLPSFRRRHGGEETIFTVKGQKKKKKSKPLPKTRLMETMNCNITVTPFVWDPSSTIVTVYSARFPLSFQRISTVNRKSKSNIIILHRNLHIDPRIDRWRGHRAPYTAIIRQRGNYYNRRYFIRTSRSSDIIHLVYI